MTEGHVARTTHPGLGGYAACGSAALRSLRPAGEPAPSPDQDCEHGYGQNDLKCYRSGPLSSQLPRHPHRSSSQPRPAASAAVLARYGLRPANAGLSSGPRLHRPVRRRAQRRRIPQRAGDQAEGRQPQPPPDPGQGRTVPPNPGHHGSKLGPPGAKISIRRAARMHRLGAGYAHCGKEILVILDPNTATVIELCTGEIPHTINPTRGYWSKHARPPGRWPGGTTGLMSRLR